MSKHLDQTGQTVDVNAIRDNPAVQLVSDMLLLAVLRVDSEYPLRLNVFHQRKKDKVNHGAAKERKTGPGLEEQT